MMVVTFTAILVLFSVFARPPAARSWTVNASLSSGYDDNPGQDDDRQGSGFVLSRLAVGSRNCQLLGVDVDSAAYFSYQALEAVGDNYSLGFETRLARPLPDGRGLLTLVLNPEIYRDDCRPEDEVNTFAASLALTRFAAAGELTLAGEITGFDYVHKAAAGPGRSPRSAGPGRSPRSAGPPAGSRSGLFSLAGISGDPGGSGVGTGTSGSMGTRPPTGGHPRGSSREERHDWLATGRVTGEKSLPGFLTLLAAASCSYLDSTVEVEKYRGCRLTAGFTWLPAPDWELEGMGWWRRQVFLHVPRDGHRHDYERGVEFTVRRRWGKCNLFADLLVMRHESPVEVEDYRRNVIQCGVSYPF